MAVKNQTKTNSNNTIRRRVEFFELFYNDIDGERVTLEFDLVKDIFLEIKNNISNFEFTDGMRFRWYGVDSVNINADSIEIIMKNCIYQYSPDIINVNSKIERPNNRNLDEGDKEKTHYLIKRNHVVYEKKRNGSPISVFKSFINEVVRNTTKEPIKDLGRVDHSLIMVHNFLKLFEESTRIKNVNITVDKSHDLEEYSRFHNDENVKGTYTIEYKAKRSKSINKDTIRFYLDKFINGSNYIEKITMDINNEDEDSMTINTDSFAKHSYLEVNKDSKGVVNSSSMFFEMGEL